MPELKKHLLRGQRHRNQISSRQRRGNGMKFQGSPAELSDRAGRDSWQFLRARGAAAREMGGSPVRNAPTHVRETHGWTRALLARAAGRGGPRNPDFGAKRFKTERSLARGRQPSRGNNCPRFSSAAFLSPFFVCN